MTAQEWWEDVRNASLSISSARIRLNAMREPKGASGGFGSIGITSDPTASVSVAVMSAEESLARLVRELEKTIDDGYKACHTIGLAVSQDAALVMQLYFVDGKSWSETSRIAHMSRSSCLRMRNQVFELTDDIGVARLVNGWSSV